MERVFSVLVSVTAPLAALADSSLHTRTTQSSQRHAARRVLIVSHGTTQHYNKQPTATQAHGGVMNVHGSTHKTHHGDTHATQTTMPQAVTSAQRVRSRALLAELQLEPLGGAARALDALLAAPLEAGDFAQEAREVDAPSDAR